MTLSRVLDDLADRFPAEDAMVPDLDRIRLLTDLLGHPQRAYPAIHLTGTNGKTSTARMIDALLQSFGLRVGRFTSPHLHSVTERITLNGEPLSEESFVAAYDEIAPYVELVDSRSPHRMTFFEVLTGMAFAVFADAPIDVAVLEVGLGGTWDATNVVDAQTCVVLPVGLDHVPLLGTTVAEIAGEKAGIISAGATAVLAQQPPEAAAVLLRRCVEVGATVAREGLEFGVASRSVAVGGQLLDLQGLSGRYDEIFLPLHGAHQAANAAAALAAVEAFMAGVGELDVERVREGFAQSASPGRLEVVRTNPTVLVDAAHNAPGMAAAVAGLSDAFAFDELTGVVAVLADKPAREMLEVLEPILASVIVTESTSPRRLPAADLYDVAVAVFGADRVDLAESLELALARAMRRSAVLVTGSVVTVAEARRLLAAP
ncbi:MAG TPA: folylpolyglutamate synthase/dihydrofolate synthase family protein [Mycobacteriales bacterium]|nr:folylpolyglutamate synthase/dihydrofolate synthase family protein [Mycobacteriales bacterium]